MRCEHDLETPGLFAVVATGPMGVIASSVGLVGLKQACLLSMAVCSNPHVK